MRKLVLTAILSLTLLAACNKDEPCQYTGITTFALPAEIAQIEAYLAGEGITDAVEHSTGVFYRIVSVGTGAGVGSLCNTVNLIYSGYRFNVATAFDSYTGAAGLPLVLGETILGFQKCLPLIKAGGTITLYIPPSFAYGNRAITDANGNVVIPANSYLKFDVTLVSVK